MSDTIKAESHRGISRGRQFVAMQARKRDARAARSAIQRENYDALTTTDTNTRRKIHGIVAAR